MRLTRMNAKQQSSRDKQIVELRGSGQTLEAIAQQFGLTRERVRQITSHYHITRRFTTVPEPMSRYGVTQYEVTKAVEAAGLNEQRIWHRRFVFTDADVDMIVAHLNLNVVRRCIFCGRSFEVRGLSQKRLCSTECFKEHRRRTRRCPRGMSETTRRIQELLSAEPPGSHWVGFTEAVRLSGLRRMQLTWLRWRGIIGCKPSGRGSKFGPIMLYSARHCDLLRGLELNRRSATGVASWNKPRGGDRPPPHLPPKTSPPLKRRISRVSDHGQRPWL